MISRRATYITDSEMIEYYKKLYGWNSKFMKTKIMIKHYAKKSFLMVYLGMYDCYDNIKVKLWSTISILN